ncbi:rCG61063, isoform CRA_b [Rattus norvegicus]|uniref:RCG61063, isoform CRA_b n=1 Tax=Rattus norvegicus TaxID=10116 RepID=A6JJC7_RAT|nr:rCG61063, isoform CRA_b [Rattus norvegicus]
MRRESPDTLQNRVLGFWIMRMVGTKRLGTADKSRRMCSLENSGLSLSIKHTSSTESAVTPPTAFPMPKPTQMQKQLCTFPKGGKHFSF